MSSKVYWAARDLATSPLGNHHFILVVQGTPTITSTMSVKWQNCAGTEFITIATFAKKLGGKTRLILGYNETSDVHSVKEVLNPSITSFFRPDFDLARHEVKPPNGNTVSGFVRNIIMKAEAYKKNEAKKHVPYDLVDENCACWVNSLFKACGVPKKARIAAGEFPGFDWGEEDEIDAGYFS